MSEIHPELEVVQHANNSIRYLEHGWPHKLCRWHCHKEYELHYIAESVGTVFIGDYVSNFRPKSLFLIGPFLPHNWISDDKKIEVRDRLVQFDTDVFNKKAIPEFAELEGLFGSSVHGIEFTNFDYRKCESYFDAVRHTKGLERIILTLEFIHTLSIHSQQKTLSLSNFDYNKNSNQMNVINSSINYILKNFQEDISLEYLAMISNSSKSTYCRQFQKVLGINFSEFLARIRIAKACTLLYQTQHPVSSICYEVGFRNLSNFNRHFSRLKKTTPTHYRQVMNNSMKATNYG